MSRLPAPFVMPIGLRTGVSCCEASGHLVLLDIDADRYFGLDPAAEGVFRDLLEGRSPSLADIDPLVQTGVLSEGPNALPPRCCAAPALPSASLLERDAPKIPLPSIVLGLAELIRVRLELRYRGLAHVLRTLAARKARVSQSSGSDRATEFGAALFRECALVLRSCDQCLVRSIAFTRWLAAHDVRADLVIGVRARPFSAHAWVQTDRALLNETCDGVRGYAPILVV